MSKNWKKQTQNEEIWVKKMTNQNKGKSAENLEKEQKMGKKETRNGRN